MQMFEGPSTRSFAQRSRCADRSGGGHSLIGICADRTCDTLMGSLVTASGHKLEADYRHQLTEQLKVPDRLRDLVYANSAQQFPTGTQDDGVAYATLIQEISLLQADLIRRLCRLASMPIDDVLAVGLLGPGCWHSARSGQRCYLELCDPARVAEAVGCNVVSQFPQRDLATGGLGGPLHAVPQWLLLGDPQASRLLLDVGRSVRLTFIPRGRSEEILDQVLSFDVGPGTSLLDQLSLRLSEGRMRYDPGGTLAVQGKKIQELIDCWLKDPYFQEVPPRWQPHGVCAEQALASTVRMAVEMGWSIRDLLCTATHFIARCIAHAVNRHIPGGINRIDELLVAGGGQGNGMLLAEVRTQLGQRPLSRLVDLDLPDGALEAASTAVLTGMHLDRISACRPAISGVHVSRVAGQLTAGSPAGWGRLIRYMHQMAPTHLSLRNAV